MPTQGIERALTDLLEEMNARGGYSLALVCTEEGLLVASAGERLRSEVVAGITGLFDDVARRVARELELESVDELTVCAGKGGRMVVRCLGARSRPRLFLVVQVPAARAWRRNTSTVARKVRAILDPLVGEGDDSR